MLRKCFVIQRFDGARYDSLYDQVFRPAIEEAGFKPYRVDHYPAASIPIESIEKEISGSDACFVELSEDAPNVWFELGYSVARDKPLCLVCSSTRIKFPFDIQHRQIIRYPDQPVPNDFIELKSKIVERLKSLLKNEVALQQNSEAAQALAVGPNTSGLKPHEVLALTMIFQGKFMDALTNWTLNNEMSRAGYTGVAAGLAITGLFEKGLLVRGLERDDNGNTWSTLLPSKDGEKWIMDHQDELNLRVEKKFTDEDIPF